MIWNLLTPIQAAEDLGITEAELQILREGIDGPKYIIIGGNIRYPKEYLTEWDNKRKGQNKEESTMHDVSVTEPKSITEDDLKVIHTNLEHVRSLVSAIRELHCQSLAHKNIAITKFYIEQKISPLMDIIEDLTRTAQTRIEDSAA